MVTLTQITNLENSFTYNKFLNYKIFKLQNGGGGDCSIFEQWNYTFR